MADLLTTIISNLRENKWTLGFAESCTGGLVASTLTARAGVSDIFRGGVVAYANEVKSKVLGVDPQLIIQFGAVSEVVARQMVRGAKGSLQSSWAISITGVAGPSGGSLQAPVGTVWFAVAGPGVEVARVQHFSGDRVAIQTQSVSYALELLGEQLRNTSSQKNY